MYHNVFVNLDGFFSPCWLTDYSYIFAACYIWQQQKLPWNITNYISWQVTFRGYTGAKIRDYECLIAIDILDYMSIEQVCIAIIILVLLICFSGDLILTRFSF